MLSDKDTINDLWSKRHDIIITSEHRESILRVLSSLNDGSLRLAEYDGSSWITHEWIKKAVSLSFRVQTMHLFESGVFRYFDKCEVKFSSFNENDFVNSKCRVVPGAIVRFGSYIAPGVILMPSFVNVGCYVDNDSMIDIGAVLGGGAQIGKRCHISANSVIAGVIEPVQACPVIIEDDVMVGAGVVVAEGVVVKRGSVLGAGVNISASTKIFNRVTGEVSYGQVPEYSVVVPGSLPDKSGCSISCAVIVKTVDNKTRKMISPNELLRDSCE
ncbi:2,3,4,5-tetrahydropyridine-2,6-dicarboxylate N-succinyltransferase [Candidatus Ichthyocystis hellenicum]|uniref:2,3,4,5-tetrahydropyridine-2,6-dicarboxylate N-succinyltransferase n=1 Tax=Candidatus Ichthyocystis hellenicum TaxID=1561003 RepID=UPI000A4F27A5|nr:2,3,4,5-tetrahydropyridine-2,6-dicarboxylate N-succinyltransferase [Candidatus Ichthyocystis hellenicum]